MEIKDGPLKLQEIMEVRQIRKAGQLDMVVDMVLQLDRLNSSDWKASFHLELWALCCEDICQGYCPMPFRKEGMALVGCHAHIKLVGLLNPQ